MSDIRMIDQRSIDAVDRIVDTLCPDDAPYCDRVTDACFRVVKHYGLEVVNTGNRRADALEAIAKYYEKQKFAPAESASDITEVLLEGGDDEVRVELTGDVQLNTALTVPTGKKATIDLGGNKLLGTQALLVSGDVVLKNGTVESTGKSIIVHSGGSVVIEDANIVSKTDCAICANGAGAKIIVNGGSVTAQEVPILAETGAEVVINGGTFTGIDNFVVGGNGSAGRGGINVTINDGVFIAKIQSAGYIAAGVYMPNDGTFTMNGGKIISSGAGIVMRAGEVNLNGGEIVAYGPSGVRGKVGDSRVVVGPYAVVYDESARYPAVNSMALSIGSGMVLTGTDGDIETLLSDGASANINDNR